MSLRFGASAWIALGLCLGLAFPASPYTTPSAPPPPPRPDPGPSPAVGAWPHNGIPICIAPGERRAPKGADDYAHGAYFTWADARNGEWDIFALRIGPDGQPSPGWPANGKPVCTVAGEQSSAVCVTDGTWGTWVLWEDLRSGSRALYVQKLTAAGEVAPGWPEHGQLICTSAGAEQFQFLRSAEPDRFGGLVLTWFDKRADTVRVGATHLDSDGLPVAPWPACGRGGATEWHRVDICSDAHRWLVWSWSLWPDRVAASYVEFGPVGFPHCDGCGCITTFTYNSTNFIVYEPSGTQVHGESFGIASGYFLRAGMEENGSAFVINSGELRRLGAYGHPSWFVGNALVFDAFGGFSDDLLALTNADPSPRFMRFLDSGVRAPGFEITGPPLCEAPCRTGQLRIAVEPGGGILAVWEDRRTTPHRDLYASWLRGGGQRGPGWRTDGDPFATRNASKELGDLVGNRRGAAIASWREFDGADWTIYAYRITTDLPTPTLASLVSSRADADGVHLFWQLAEALPRVEVQRREDPGAWGTLAVIAADGTRQLRHHDADVLPGRTYEYRLRIEGEPVAETRVAVPDRARFDFDGARPNPSGPALSVSFSLPRQGAVELQVLDVTGRLAARASWEAVGAGRHVRAVEETGLLSPGVYLLRLAFEDRTLERKVVVAK